jgi:aminopeptidase N
MRTARLLALLLAALPTPGAGQQQEPLTRADTLRGTLTPERSWWDVVYYDLSLHVDPPEQSVSGSTRIRYAVTGAPRDMQIDLAAPLQADSVVQQGARLQHRREGDVLLVQGAAGEGRGPHELTVHFSGRPTTAVNPPWDGGFVWALDAAGNPWVGTAVQGIGASQFWPNKDHQSDEPDSMRIRVTVPSSMVEISNGRLEETRRNADGTTTYTWRVTNPINNYGVTVNAGAYVHFGDRFDGENGSLDLDYWVLEENLEAARRQFEQVEPMLRCFESWFGPYPFYEDGFKLVESPYLGMEHQSAIAYGNRYRNGYLGQDLSGTGLGLSWDYIIVHEAGHEWFGNNLTTADIADMWVHEGFTTYAEGI